MSVESVLRAIADHVAELVNLLDLDGQERLLNLADAMAAGDRDQILDALSDFTAALVPQLPEYHPVSRELRSGVRFSTGTAVSELPPDVLAWCVSARELLGSGLGDGDDPPRGEDGEDGEDGDADGLEAQVRRRLLAAPALSEADLRGAGRDPHAPDLIRLTDDAGSVRILAFQFDRRLMPVPVVLGINRRLGSDDDPWGVADWWLGENAWLDAVPADLVGVVDDDLLLRCAEAVLRPDAGRSAAAALPAPTASVHPAGGYPAVAGQPCGCQVDLERPGHRPLLRRGPVRPGARPGVPVLLCGADRRHRAGRDPAAVAEVP